MTREEAIKQYLANHFKAEEDIQRLCLYDPKGSLTAFSGKIKLSITAASALLIKNGLGRNRTEAYHAFHLRKKAEYEKLWNANLTLRENAKRLNKGKDQAYSIAWRYNLPYLPASLTNQKLKRRTKRILELRKKGVNEAEMGRFFGLSRERIRQLIAEAPRYGDLNE